MIVHFDSQSFYAEVVVIQDCFGFRILKPIIPRNQQQKGIDNDSKELNLDETESSLSESLRSRITQLEEELTTIKQSMRMHVSDGKLGTHEILERAVGTDKSVETANRLTASLQVRPFDFVRKVDPSHLLNFLEGEHPQTIALVLSYLEPQKSALILSALKQELKPDISWRISTMDRVSPDILREVERVLERKLSMLAGYDYISSGGIDAMVEVLNYIDRNSEKIIIESLEKDDPKLAEELKKRMFVFEDIVLLSDESLRKVFKEVSGNQIAMCLKGIEEEVQQKIFTILGNKRSENIREAMEKLGAVSLRDVEESQQHVVNVIRQLEEQGEVYIGRAGEENPVKR